MSRGKVVRRWVSRFDIYPYLERYTVDAAAEINRQVRTPPCCCTVRI